jgi:methionyl-tRNA synthetase
MNTVLYVTIETLRAVGILVQPVVPTAGAALLDLLAVSPEARMLEHVGESHRLVPGTALPAPAPIFPRFVEPEAA